ncbi:MAG: SLC13 family permease [Acidimicrobiales bacterium]
MTAARIVLLLLGVAGAVSRPMRVPAFLAPVVCALVSLATGLISWHEAGRAMGPLETPLGFLLCAIPLSVLLDRYGYFEDLAGLFGGGRWLVPGLWLLGTGTVAVLNLDAAVVLLTPLYLRIAARHGRSPRFLGFQPVILALVASSFLPVSNLTNLIAAARFGIGPVELFEHLGLPGLAACAVGYLCYRGSSSATDRGGQAIASPAAPVGAVSSTGTARRDRRVLVVGSVVVCLLLVGFVVGPSFGVREWEVALGADLVLVALTRRLPLGSIPWTTALLAGGLGVLAAAAVQSLDLRGLLGGPGPLGMLRDAAVSAVGANVVNNLPALLVALPFVSGPTGHATCALWPVLLGVNMGPGLLITGSLASLLWIDSMHRLGTPVSAGQYMHMGLRVVLPAGLAAVGVLMALAPALGCR